MMDSSDGAVGRRLFFEEHGIAKPVDFNLVTIQGKTIIHVAYLDFDKGNLVIHASARRDAYDIADCIWGYFSLIGRTSESVGNTFFLLETRRRPKQSWSERELLAALHEIEKDADHSEIRALRSGYTLQTWDLQRLRLFVPQLLARQYLRDSLSHLAQSQLIFDGPSAHHQMPDRRFNNRRWEEKRYYENRRRYELAFVSGFKALEAFFGVNDIKQREVSRIIDAHRSADIRAASSYQLLYPVTGSRRLGVSYAETLAHLLRVRNAVAAHANRNAPRDLFVSERRLIELQRFVMHLVAQETGIFDAA